VLKLLALIAASSDALLVLSAETNVLVHFPEQELHVINTAAILSYFVSVSRILDT